MNQSNLSDEELFSLYIEEQKYSEVVELPRKPGKTIMKAEVFELKESQAKEAKVSAMKRVANDLGVPITSIDENNSLYVSELYKECVVRTFYYVNSKQRMFSDHARLSEYFSSDDIYMMYLSYANAQANASKVFSVTSTSDDGDGSVFEKLKNGALEPKHFLEQSSPVSILTLLNIFLDHMKKLANDNSSLTYQLSALTNKTTQSTNLVTLNTSESSK